MSQLVNKPINIIDGRGKIWADVPLLKAQGDHTQGYFTQVCMVVLIDTLHAGSVGG